MKNKEFIKINTRKSKRYLLVLALFLVSIIFGKNLDSLTQLGGISSGETAGSRVVSAGESGVLLTNFYSIKKGQCGRLFFSYKNLAPSDFLVKNDPEIQVVTENYFEEKQVMGIFKLSNSRFAQNERLDFCATSDYQNLSFKKSEKFKNNNRVSFEVFNISFYPLSIEKKDFNNLLPPIIGNTDFSKVVLGSNIEPKVATKTFKLTRKNQIIGQTFTANSKMISGVDLKLNFVGTGGAGNYYLDLREVDDLGGVLKLSSYRVAYYCFNKEIAEKNLKIGEKIYHIPLAANLELGKKYFIGVSNTEVNFNFLNTLIIYGVAGGIDTGEIVTLVGNITHRDYGAIYFKLYGAEYIINSDERVLTGEKIIDNGNGTGLYFYEQTGNFSDYLDIFRVDTKENSNHDIFYDNIQRGVSARDRDENAFTYKINTVYPFTSMKIVAEQPGKEFTDAVIYYSFDNEKWQQIISTEENENIFKKLIRGDETAETVYLKITYDKKSILGKSAHLFGIKNLKVVAKVKLNQ